MKKIKSTFINCLAFAFVAVTTFTGCSSVTSKSKGPIVLNYLTYRAGQNVGAKLLIPQVERFNTKYKGKYKVVIEEVPQDSYDAKIKQLALVNKLPALIDSMADTTWLKNYVAKNNVSYDLTSWLNKNPDIKKLCLKESLNYCTVNGKVFIMPIIITSPTGSFYNTTMYKPNKPIRDMTVSEFQASLKNNKIAFMTGENAWTTQLFFSSLIANQPGGPELLKSHVNNKITNFSSDIFVNAATQLLSFLQKNASSNTLGAAYADADNNILSKHSALIFNGPWMFSDFLATSKDKWSNGFAGNDIVPDLYPGNITITNTSGYGGAWISSKASADQKEVALAFLGFACSQSEIEQSMLVLGGVTPNLQASNDFKSKVKNNTMLSQYIAAVNKNTLYVPGFDDVVIPSVAEPGFPNLLPDLISGKLTPKTFCDKLTALSKEAD